MPRSTGAPPSNSAVHKPTMLVRTYADPSWVLPRKGSFERTSDKAEWDRWEENALSMLFLSSRLKERSATHGSTLLHEDWISRCLSEQTHHGMWVHSNAIPQRKIENDLDWFASAQTELERFRGQYVAIRNREILGWGVTSIDAYRMAKKKKPEAEPAIAFVPESEDSVF